jgi:hypothetical protein
MEECVKPKAMWDHLKPHMDNLIAHFVFLNVLIGLAQDRENEVGDQVIHMRLQVVPHSLRLEFSRDT